MKWIIIGAALACLGCGSDAKATMDFTDNVKAQTVVDEKGIRVIGFCWQERPFLVATQTGWPGGGGLQLLRVEGWCE